MRPPYRKAGTSTERQREQRRVDRNKAVALSDAYAHVGQLKIDLTFTEGEGTQAPSAQSHSFYPSARAFFRFGCPYSDCDGEFDLTAPVAAYVQPSKGKPGVANGHLDCKGMRHAGAGEHHCAVAVNYRIALLETA